MAEERKLIRVVCAIIKGDNGRILAAQRGESQNQAGLWEFPGGKVDPGETTCAALLRELDEELSIEVKCITPLKEVIHHYPGCSIKLIPYICEIVRGKPTAHEHSEVRWVTLKEAYTLRWAPADIPVLEEFCHIEPK
ncbi:(deoxy)nucleoside triphosphate pyrophosphohydrolase [Chitinispirillales bacterium ANBcel5]|uniref:(deoxy)nucleoside triphosphate pyrophosphohydrolase n=1 Tax=Cellulosispirillum alkaliphilum TaxID=3039283 RepID=UPI002A52B6B6|nr:(deoxy)nucleoside triphosphate pyrophosphohydrolase [Chitinispirillales bacterium ANBcel5]